MVLGCRVVLLGSLPAQTIFILTSLQLRFWSGRCKSRPSFTGLGGDWSAAQFWPRGGRSPSRLWWGERSSNRRRAAKKEAAAWVRRTDQRDTKADVVAARRARAWASMRMKLDASLLHLPLLQCPGPPNNDIAGWVDVLGMPFGCPTGAKRRADN